MALAFETKPGNIRLWTKNVLAAGSISADTEDAEFPASNLLNSKRTSVFRSDSGTTATIKIDMTNITDNYINGIALINHNLYNGNITIEESSDTNRSTVNFSQSFDPHNVIIPAGDLRAGIGAAGGYFTPEMIADYFTDAMTLCYLSQGLSVSYLWIDLTEPAGTALTAISCGCIYGADIFVPDYNIRYAPEILPMDKTRVTENDDSGSDAVDIFPKRRSVTFQPSRISDRQLFWDWFRLNYGIGRRTPIIVDVLPQEKADFRALMQLYGRIREPRGISFTSFNWNDLSGGLTVDELL